MAARSYSFRSAGFADANPALRPALLPYAADGVGNRRKTEATTAGKRPAGRDCREIENFCMARVLAWYARQDSNPETVRWTVSDAKQKTDVSPSGETSVFVSEAVVRVRFGFERV